MANIASSCEYSYGAMGKVGFLYESMKDQLRWNNLSVKRYIMIVSQIGKVMSMDDKYYNQARAKAMKMKPSDIADALKTAFGDGK